MIQEFSEMHLDMIFPNHIFYALCSHPASSGNTCDVLSAVNTFQQKWKMNYIKINLFYCLYISNSFTVSLPLPQVSICLHDHISHVLHRMAMLSINMLWYRTILDASSQFIHNLCNCSSWKRSEKKIKKEYFYVYLCHHQKSNWHVGAWQFQQHLAWCN